MDNNPSEIKLLHLRYRLQTELGRVTIDFDERLRPDGTKLAKVYFGRENFQKQLRYRGEPDYEKACQLALTGIELLKEGK